MRREGLFYVDKTRQLVSLLRPEHKYIFLARPRRFGKTLLISTLEALLQGRRQLFAETWIADQPWDWTPHTVVRLDMAALDLESVDMLKSSLQHQLRRFYRQLGLDAPEFNVSPGQLLSDLIQDVSVTSQVDVLIDEYDAPILRHLDRSQELLPIRDFLRDFYGVLKARDAELQFVLLTGITRFARTNIFSGLNNLYDISTLPGFSDLVGFTVSELQTNFAPYLTQLAQSWMCPQAEVLQRIEDWYNGYLFAEEGESIYNPYSTLKCLQDGRIGNYWADTGTPTFLTRLMAQRQTDPRELLGRSAVQVATATYDLESPDLAAVMYQTGYLSLSWAPVSGALVTDFPNREVEQTFSQSLLGSYVDAPEKARSAIEDLAVALQEGDFDTFWVRYNILLRQIPYEIQGERHQYFQLVLHLVCLLIGYELGTTSERSTHRGRIDTVVELADRAVVFECKMDASAQVALAQIEDKGYAQSLRDRGLAVVGIGVNFDSRQRQATGWEVRHFG